MSLNPTRLTFTRTGWIIYAIIEVVLFVFANTTAKNASHPGTFSNILFGAFIAGLVVALVLGVMTIVRQRRGAH